MEKTKRIDAGETLIREGQDSAEMYFLIEGQMAVFKVRGNAEVRIGDIFQGEIVGEMSFLDKQPRSATVKAVTDCELMVIQPEILDSIHSKQPKWYKALVNTLLDRLRRANSKIKV